MRYAPRAPRTLEVLQDPNSVLHQPCRELTREEILGNDMQELAADMAHTLETHDLGIALAAPQVGQSVMAVVFGLRPKPNRPNVEPFSAVAFNLEVVYGYGELEPKKEACVSCGKGDDTLYGDVLRYNEVTASWRDIDASLVVLRTSGLLAQAIQHEGDHLKGKLCTDRFIEGTVRTAAEDRERMLTQQPPCSAV